MSWIDYVVLVTTMVGIAAYGIWRTRGTRELDTYLKGSRKTSWGTIGLSVMATQASAITFLSTPGQAYESGMAFVQNYFGLPLALIIVAAVFLPIYRRLRVYTAYEYLGIRFDAKTRLLGAILFLLQRGLAAGITIYAPAIIVSTILHWPLDTTILLSGLIVILYTVTGGSQAVNITQKYQMAVILGGMFTAFVVLLSKMPSELGFNDLLHVAGGFGKLQAVNFTFDVNERYTVWSGILGGLFLSLSYFGTDQSQVQRYLSGESLAQSRLGLMFNAVLKIPMQFFILLLGALVFVFYQFERPPLYFNATAWNTQIATEEGAPLLELQRQQESVHLEKEARIMDWIEARKSGDPSLEAATRAEMLAAHERSENLRQQAHELIVANNPSLPAQDADYVFITFVLDHLPVGVVGLLLAVIFAAAFSSTSAELNALGSTTVVDLYGYFRRKGKTGAPPVSASRWFTMLWGVVAVSFALFANLVENLIEAINILGSIFYGVMLGLFLTAFFLKKVGGTAVYIAALTAQALVIILFFTLEISYLWYNFIGCAACLLFSLAFQSFIAARNT